MENDLKEYAEAFLKNSVEESVFHWLRLHLQFGDDIMGVTYRDKEISIHYVNQSKERDSAIKIEIDRFKEKVLSSNENSA